LENVSQEEVVLSQKGTLVKKYIFIKYRKQVMFFIKIFKNSNYKKYFFYFSKLHRFFFFKFIGILKKIEGLK